MKAGTLEIELITNVAKLQKEMREIRRATAMMQDGVVGDVAKITRATEKAGGGMVAMGGKAKLSANHVQNLTFQLNDMFVGLASGQKPMTVFMQQGAQIGQIAQQAGLGIAGMARAMLGMAGAAALAIATNPLLLALAATVATAYGAFKLFQSSVASTGELDAYAKSLGLTKKQMKELGDTSLTFGDVMAGLWKAMTDRMPNVIKGLESLKTSAIATFKAWLEFGKMTAAATYAAFVGSYNGIAATWKMFPAVMGEFAVNAANAHLKAIEWLANKAIDTLNMLSGFANKAFEALGISTRLGKLDHVQIAEIKNSYSGAGATAAGAFAASYKDAYGSAIKAQDGFWADVGRGAIQHHKDGMKIKAEDIIGDATTKKVKEKVDEIAKMIADVRGDIFDKAAAFRAQPKFSGMPTLSDAVKAAEASIAARGDNRRMLDLQPYEDLLDKMRDISRAAADTAQAMQDAFGKVGGAIGDVISIMADYGAQQAKIDRDVQARALSEADGRKQSMDLQLMSYGNLAGAAKGLFKEHSAGFKAMAAAEKALTMIQLARTAIDVAGGAARMFATLGPFAFPAVAAMLAVMASLGFRGGGKGGAAPKTAEQQQAAQGAGSVLGDSSAKSGSISRALDLIGKNSNRDLEYSSAMLQSLRAIESNIGNLSSLLGRQLGLSNGAFDQSGLGLGSSSSNPLKASLGGYLGMVAGAMLGNPLSLIFGIGGALLTKLPVIGDIIGGIAKAIFHVKTTVSLLDQGITLNSKSIADILANGVSGLTYQDIQIKKKKKLFGIGVGGSTTVKTVTNPLDDEVSNQIGLLIENFHDAIVSSAKVLGLDVAAALATFEVEIGRISLKDLKGDEITKALEGVFSKLGDDMAGFAVAGLSDFQKLGEGLFETLTRLAKDYLTIDASLSAIGKTFGSVGAASVQAREDLLDLFGGLDAFTEATQAYQTSFLSEAQQMVPVIAAVRGEMGRLGLAGVTTREQFKSVIDGLDLSTESGRQLYAALLNVAPAFAKVIDVATELAKKSNDLQIRLMTAQGNASGALALQRQMELDATEASLKPLLQQVYAAEDMASAAQTARDAIDQTAETFRQFADAIRAYRATLKAESMAGGASYRGAQVEFIKQSSLANVGDQGGLGSLPDASRAFLEASRANARTLQQYQRDVGSVLAALDQAAGVADAMAQPAGLVQLNQQTAQISGTLDRVVVTVAESGAATKDEVAQLRSDLNAALQAIAANTGKLVRNSDRVIEGDTLKVSAPDPLPVDTTP